MSAIPVPGLLPFPRRRSSAEAAPRLTAHRWNETFGRAKALLALFVVVTILTFGASGLAGNMMLERARKSGEAARERLAGATGRETVLRQRLEAITNPRAIEEWALEHGFASPERLAALSEPTHSPVRASTRSSSGTTESAVSSLNPEAVALLHSSGVSEDGPSYR